MHVMMKASPPACLIGVRRMALRGLLAFFPAAGLFAGGRASAIGDTGSGPVIAAIATEAEQKPVTELQLPASSTPAAPSRGVVVIAINSIIGPDLLSRIRAALKNIDANRFPAGVVLLLNSPGGDGVAAMEIGRLVRAAKAHAFVRGRCTSACVFILAGSVVRSNVSDHAIGIHRPRLTMFAKGLGIVDIDPASNPNAVKALDLLDRQLQDFLREMGMPDTLYKAMMDSPSGQMRYLSRAELAEFGLLGFDPAYREARVPEGANRYMVSEDEFVRRTLLVQEACLAEKTTPQEFVRCYRRVLEKGER